VGTTYSLNSDLTQSEVGAGVPLTGTIQTSGFPCFSNGTTANPPSTSNLDSNVVFANYVMNDGAQVELVGTISNAAGTQMLVTIVYVYGDSCAGSYYFTEGSTNSLLLKN